MDDPTPISFDTDGTLYKRAVRLPNGDWAPVTDCCCGPGGCECVLPQSRYDFDQNRSFQPDNLYVQLRLDRCYTEIEYNDGTKHRVEIRGQIVPIDTPLLAINGVMRNDFSRKGRCGFGTGRRDVHPKVNWDGLNLPHAMIGEFSSVGKPIRYNWGLSSWIETILDTPFPVLSTIERPGEDPILTETECNVHLLYRFVCDSIGIDREREGIESRMPSKFGTFGTANEFVPGAMMEFAVALGYKEQVPVLLAPCGTTLFSPFINPLPNQGVSQQAVVLVGGFLQASFVSGQTYAGVTVGEFPVGVIGGNHPAYPTDPAISLANFSEIVEYGNPTGSASLNPAALLVRFTNGSRTLRRLQAQFEPGLNVYARIESLTDIGDLNFGFTHEIIKSDGVSRASQLRVNQDWTPGTDVNGQIPSDLAVGVYRKCGSGCDDKFIDYWYVRSFGSRRIRYRGDVYEYVGRDFIDTPNDDLLDNDDFEITNDGCDGVPTWPVAVSCDGTAFITYDPGDQPPGTITFLFDDVRYKPTIGESTESPPAGIAWDTEECATSEDIYRINFCRSSGAANQTFTLDPDTNGLRSQTVGYRPGNGLVPGEGHVSIQIPGESLCLTQVAATPTVIPLDTEPEVVLTSRPGTCRGIPSVVVDPRGECQPTDGGGGGIIPDSPNLTALSDLTDTDISAFQLGNLVEQALKTISLNKLETCPACQRRKEVLNRYGDRVGKAILRVLNW